MILKGEISNIIGDTYEVFIREKNYVTKPLPKGEHIVSLKINDMVTVGFYNNILAEGIILAKEV